MSIESEGGEKSSRVERLPAGSWPGTKPLTHREQTVHTTYWPPANRKHRLRLQTGSDIILPGDLTGSSSDGRGQRSRLRRFNALHSASAAAGSSSHGRLPPEGLPCSQEDTGTGGVPGNSQSDITGSHSNSVGTQEGRKDGDSPEDCVQ